MNTIGAVFEHLKNELHSKLESENYFPTENQEVFIVETCYPVMALYVEAREFSIAEKEFNPSGLLKKLPHVNLDNRSISRTKKNAYVKEYDELLLRTLTQLECLLHEISSFDICAMDIDDEVESLIEKIPEILKAPPVSLHEHSLIASEHVCLRDLAIIFRKYAIRANTSKQNSKQVCGLGTNSPFVNYIRLCYNVAGYPELDAPKSLSWIRERLNSIGLQYDNPKPPLPELADHPEALVIKYALPLLLKMKADLS